jgi:hypothetical protein
MKANVKSVYAKQIEKVVRSLSFYLSEIRKDFDGCSYKAAAEAAAEAKKAAKSKEEKEAAKAAEQRAAEAKNWYFAEENKERIAAAEAVFNQYKFTADNLTFGYLKNWYPFVNRNGKICDVRKIAAEAEAEFKAEAEQKGYEFTYNKDNVLLWLVPVEIWTSNKLLTKFAAAKKAEAEAAKQQSQLEREKESAKKEIAKIEALKLRLAELEAKQQKRAAAAEAAKATQKAA